MRLKSNDGPGSSVTGTCRRDSVHSRTAVSQAAPVMPRSEAMEPCVPEPPVLYERFTVTYPSGTVIPSLYTGGTRVSAVSASQRER